MGHFRNRQRKARLQVQAIVMKWGYLTIKFETPGWILGGILDRQKFNDHLKFNAVPTSEVPVRTREGASAQRYTELVGMLAKKWQRRFIPLP